MKYIFWISWIIDASVSIWWVLSDLKLEYIQPNPYSFIFLIYVVASILFYQFFGMQKIGLVLSLIPAIPLVVMTLIMIIASVAGAKWN